MNRVVVITLVISAIFAFAAAPPLGMILLLVAFFGNRNRRAHDRRYAAEARERAQRRAERESIVAWKSVPE